MSSPAIYRLSQQKSTSESNAKSSNNNETTSATSAAPASTPTKTTTIKLHFDAMQQKPGQQQQQQTTHSQQLTSGGGNIILLRGSRNESGQIIIQNKHDIINFINEQQQKQQQQQQHQQQKQLSTITTTSTTGSLNQLPSTTTVARKLVHTTSGGTEICTSPANITVVAKDISDANSNGGSGTAITTTNTILLQTPINASQLESVLLQTQGHLKKSTKVTPLTVTSTSLITNDQHQRPFLLRNASRSLSTDSNRIGTIIDTSNGSTISSNNITSTSNNNKGPFVLQTLKRLEKSQSILVIRNTASSNRNNNNNINNDNNTTNATLTSLSSSASSLATTATTSAPSIVFQTNERKSTSTLSLTTSSSTAAAGATSSSSTTFARAIKATLQQQQQQQKLLVTANKLCNRSISTQSLSASAVANLLNATTATTVVNKHQQQQKTAKAYLRFGSTNSNNNNKNVNSGTNNNTTATTTAIKTVFTKQQNNKNHNSQFAGNANNNLASNGNTTVAATNYNNNNNKNSNNNCSGSTPNGVSDATTQLTGQSEQISTSSTQKQQSNVPLGSDGEPIKLPDNLESLPRADSFPSQRHRWNTNEEIAAILISFDKHNEWQSKEVKTRPKSGSLLLYSRKKVRYRRDGYCWKKRKDGKTTREDHMKLKVQGTECIYGCYVHSAILPTFHRRCYWLLQNPDIVLVHYLNVPYPDDNKMAVIAPSITLWGDKKEWTKEELVSQLKPMLSTVTSDDDSDSGNDIEISTAETVESIVCQLMEKQRLSRQAALIKQLDCGCGDTACADGKTCTHPVLRRPSLMKSTATERQQRYADSNQQQQLTATHAGSSNTPNVVVGSKLYTRWSERRMRDSNVDNHHYQQQQHQQFQVIPSQQHSEHAAYQQQQQQQRATLLATRNNLSIQQQSVHHQQQHHQMQRYGLSANQQTNNSSSSNSNAINKNNSKLNNALQQKINMKSTNGETTHIMMTTNASDLISNQHQHQNQHQNQHHQQQHHHHLRNQQQNHMSTNSICDNKINRNTNNNNNNQPEEGNNVGVGNGCAGINDEANQMNTDTNVINNNGSNYNYNNTTHQHQQQQEFYKQQQQQEQHSKIQPLSNSLNSGAIAASDATANTAATTTTTTTNLNNASSTVEPMCMSPEHHPTPPTIIQQQQQFSLTAQGAGSPSSSSSTTTTATILTESAAHVVESNSSNSSSGNFNSINNQSSEYNKNNSNSNNNNNNLNNISNSSNNIETLNGCAANLGASNTDNAHSTSTILDKQNTSNDCDAMETALNQENRTKTNNPKNSSQIESNQTTALNFFNETLDLSHEDIQRTLAANMPYGSAADDAATRTEINFSHNNVKADGETEVTIAALPCSDAGGGGVGDADEDDDADDVFANLDAFDMLVEFPELDLDDKQALNGLNFEHGIVSTALEPKLEYVTTSTTTSQREKKHLLTICDFSPEWSYPEGGVKVLVAGPWTSASNYTIFFDSQPVPTILVQEGVLRCYCPAHEVGYATLQVSRDGVVISNAVMFEYRHTHCQQAATDSSTNDCLYKFSLLNRLSTIDERLQLKHEENCDSLSKQCAILLQANFEEKLVSYCQQLTKGTWITSSSGSTTTSHTNWSGSGFKGMSLLHLAAALGFSKLICTMLNWRADNPNIVLETELDALSQDYHGFTPIAWACARNHLDSVSVLYKWNHDALKIKNHAQQTPLDLAALKGYKQLVTEVYRWEQERLQKHAERSGTLGTLGLSLSAYSLNDLHFNSLVASEEFIDIKKGSNSEHDDSYATFTAALDTQKQHDGVFLRPIALANQSPPSSNRFSKRSSVDSGINMDIRTRSGKHFKDMTRLHGNFDAHDQFAATSFVGVDSPLSSLVAGTSNATNATLSSASPLRKMDFALCEVSTADTSPLPPDNENDDTSSTINNDDDITDINTDTEGGGVVGDSDAKVLTLAEHIIAAMPARIKNEADEMMVLGSPMTEPLNSESSGLNDGFMDPLLDSLPHTHFDGDFNFDFHEHNYRYHEVSTPCSSLSPASSGPLQSPASYSILGTDPSVSSPSPPPSTKQLTEFLHASSSSSQYPFEADFSKLTLTDIEQRELYEAAICIQKAYRSYKGRQKLEEQNKERTAAIVIQNYYRRYKQFAYYRQMTNAALVIQHGYRSYCKHKRFKKSQSSTITNSFVGNNNNNNSNDSQCLSSFYDHFKKDQQLQHEFNSTSTSSPKETSPSGPLKRTYSQSTQNQAARKIQQFMRQSRIKLQRERAEKEKLVHQRREEYLQNLRFRGQSAEAAVYKHE